MALRKLNLQSNDRGVAILEFALISPVLIILFLAATDFTLYLQNYFALSHVLREGGRYLAGTDILEQGIHSSPPFVVAPRQRVVHNRIRLLINGASLRIVGGVNTIQLETRCTNNVVPDPPTVQVSISATYNSLFLGSIATPQMVLTTRGPYLFQACI